MSDSLNEVRALPEGAATPLERHAALRRLRGHARTPEDSRSASTRRKHMPPAGEHPGSGHHQGVAAGGSHPRGPIQPHSAAEIAERAAQAAPGAVPFVRQFGAQSVSSRSAARVPRSEPPVPHQGSLGGPQRDENVARQKYQERSAEEQEPPR